MMVSCGDFILCIMFAIRYSAHDKFFCPKLSKDDYAHWATTLSIPLHYHSLSCSPPFSSSETVKPRIDRRNLDKKVIRSGQMLRVEIDIEGEPAPKVTWQLNGEPLRPRDRLTIENEDYHSTFVLLRAQRSDTGKFTITATNDSGTDTADLELTVVGKWHNRKV